MSQGKHSFYLSWWLVKYAMEHAKVIRSKSNVPDVKEEKVTLKERVKGRLCIAANFIQSYKEYTHVQI